MICNNLPYYTYSMIAVTVLQAVIDDRLSNIRDQRWTHGVVEINAVDSRHYDYDAAIATVSMSKPWV
jgi:hypothetical protein